MMHYCTNKICLIFNKHAYITSHIISHELPEEKDSIDDKLSLSMKQVGMFVYIYLLVKNYLNVYNL